MTARTGRGCIAVASAGLRIEIAGAALWDPRLPVPVQRLGATGLERNLDRLAELIRRDAAGKPWSFATLLDLQAHHAQESHDPGRGEEDQRALLAQWVRPAVAALLAAVNSGETARITAAARKLAGLGHGLTPAGDDFLIGVCAAIALANAMLPVSCNGAHASAVSLRDRALAIAVAADQTTTLSAVWLRHAAHAEFSAEVSRVAAALTSNDAAELEPAVGELLAVGGTSGLDTATGLLHGSRAILPNRVTV
jgi:hypothetical protein